MTCPFGDASRMPERPWQALRLCAESAWAVQVVQRVHAALAATLDPHGGARAGRFISMSCWHGRRPAR